MSKLTVIVVGHQKTGKSTIATIIATALRQYGFEVTHTDEGAASPLMPHQVRERALSLADPKAALRISVREVGA